MLTAATAQAGGSIAIDDVRSLSVGAGLRTGLTMQEGASPNGESYSKSTDLQSIRLYLGGQLHENIKLEFNTEMSSCEGEYCIRVLDAVAKITISEAFNIWAGRFLPPSDRSNLSGPYYGNSWAFPAVQQYPAIFAGRDDGLAVWGKFVDGMVKYQVGAFKGRTNGSDMPLVSSRLTLNLWDVEGGYYNSSTYYGSQDTLALGAVAMYQPESIGTGETKGDYLGWNVDFLIEKKFSFGVPTFEAAFYSYSGGDVPAAEADISEGTGFFALASYLLPGEQGPGTLQPKVRYQQFTAADDALALDSTTIDVGLDYIFDGHNARLSAVYQSTDAEGATSNAFLVGLQAQL